MSPAAPIRIRVYPRREWEARPRLFRALEGTFPVRFEGCDDLSNPPSQDALIVLGGAAKIQSHLQVAQSHCYVAREDELPSAAPGRATVYLRETPGVELNLTAFPMREEAMEVKTLPPPENGFKTAASTGRGPLWIWRIADNGSLTSHAVFKPAELGEREWLVDYARPGRFIGLLPLLHFLRWITGRQDFKSAGPMASLVIDDPNLHWPTYGHISFRGLIRHTADHAYHAAVATVPLDSWMVNSEAVALFKANPKRVSLLMHGINHTSLELAQPRTDEASLKLFGQALRRIDDLEQRSGLKVARVMEPPFGVSSATSMRAMQKLGYHGTLLSPEVALEHSRNDDWPPSFGIIPSDRSQGGFPTIPRLRIVGDWKTGAAINLCLGLPLVIATHHEDAMGGFRLFGEAADLINSVGAVRWCNLDEMTQSLYETRTEGSRLIVRPLARSISVLVPDGIEEVTVAPAWSAAHCQVAPIQSGNGQPPCCQAGNSDGTFRTGGAKYLRIDCPAGGLMDHRQMVDPGIHPWAYVRRTLTAVRDRAQPVFVRGKEGEE